MEEYIEFHILHEGKESVVRIEAPYTVQSMDEFACQFSLLLQKLGVKIENDLSESKTAVMKPQKRTERHTTKERVQFDPIAWGYLKQQL